MTILDTTRYDDMIIALDGAIVEILVSGHAEYTLDSGQTMQRVRRQDLDRLKLLLQYYESRRAQAINNAGGSSIAVPNF